MHKICSVFPYQIISLAVYVQKSISIFFLTFATTKREIQPRTIVTLLIYQLLHCLEFVRNTSLVPILPGNALLSNIAYPVLKFVVFSHVLLSRGASVKIWLNINWKNSVYPTHYLHLNTMANLCTRNFHYCVCGISCVVCVHHLTPALYCAMTNHFRVIRVPLWCRCDMDHESDAK